MAQYTRRQLHALYDAENRHKEEQYVMRVSIQIKKQVIDLARKGITHYIWKSEDVITQRVLIELCKSLQITFPDSKILTSLMGITIEWN